jgi:hypothetical protein
MAQDRRIGRGTVAFWCGLILLWTVAVLCDVGCAQQSSQAPTRSEEQQVAKNESMTAVGLLCRQYRGWGPRNPQLLAGLKILEANPPGARNMYYYYYGMQVMHHVGGDRWRQWNAGTDATGKKTQEGMRDWLISKQEKDQTKHSFGSWAPNGDAFAGAGGCIMLTSLSLLTLEIYYRHLPLYRRDILAPKEDGGK